MKLEQAKRDRPGRTHRRPPGCRLTGTLEACRHAGAFTLIELMVVIVLIGILTAMIIPEMKGTYEDALLRSTSRELVNIFSLASSRAVSLDQIHRVRLDETSGRYALEQRVRGGEFIQVPDVPGSEGELDTRISVAIQKAGEDAPETFEGEQPPAVVPEAPGGVLEGAIAFYPDGTTDGGTIKLRDRQGFQFLLRLNPITSRVHVVELARE